jgi:hypothetical protein
MTVYRRTEDRTFSAKGDRRRLSSNNPCATAEKDPEPTGFCPVGRDAPGERSRL